MIIYDFDILIYFTLDSHMNISVPFNYIPIQIGIFAIYLVNSKCFMMYSPIS